MTTQDKMTQLIIEGKIQNIYTPIALWTGIKNKKPFYVPLNGHIVDGKPVNDLDFFDFIWSL